jgi:hypothetical protein
MTSLAKKSARSIFAPPPIVSEHVLTSPTRKAALWLDAKLAALNGKIVGETVSLTPELATVLLERNTGNRAIKRNRVADMVRDIRNGDWKLNGEPVIIASDGMLNDGQNRCTAVIEADTTVDVLMVFGPARDTRDTLDQGTARTPSDNLAVHGFVNTNVLAGAARLLSLWRDTGDITSKHRGPTRAQLIAVAEENPGLSESVSFVKRKVAQPLGSQSALAFVHFALKTVANKADVNAFMEGLIEGASLTRGDPVLYARNRLIVARGEMRAPPRVELLFRAWNAHRHGEKRVSISLQGGELPKLES